MTISTGLNSHFAVSKESTVGTRVAPAVSLPLISETMGDTGSQPTQINGMIYGVRTPHHMATGKSNFTGGVRVPLTADSIGVLLEAALGDVATTGSDPYEHVFTRSAGELPSLSAQVGWTDSADTDFRKDYTGCFVNNWGFSVAGGTNPELQVDLVARDEEIDQYPLVTPAYGAFEFFEFSHLTITPDGGSAICWDSFDLTVANNLEASAAVCPDNPKATVYQDTGMTTLSGTLARDFDGSWADYTKFTAGTEATLEILFNAGSSAKLQLDLNVRYTGSTPQVAGPSNIKHPLPFVGVQPSSGEMITATLTNSDATP